MYLKLILLVIIVGMVACGNSDSQKQPASKPFDVKDTVITLKDTLGEISVSVPGRYDTFLVWTHQSDCSRCGYEKYRFQPKILPVYTESGFIWDHPEDSIDQLTIEQPQYIRIRSTEQGEIYNVHAMMKAEAMSDPLVYQDNAPFDTVQEINNRLFSVITAEHYNDSTKLFSKAVFGTTLIKGNLVTFKFALLTRQKGAVTDSFIANSRYLLSRIKIKGL